MANHALQRTRPPHLLITTKFIAVAWYNFRRKNEAIKNQTPAMASKLTDHVWTIKELIEKAAIA
jgi:hypothetical protein